MVTGGKAQVGEAGAIKDHTKNAISFSGRIVRRGGE